MRQGLSTSVYSVLRNKRSVGQNCPHFNTFQAKITYGLELDLECRIIILKIKLLLIYSIDMNIEDDLLNDNDNYLGKNAMLLFLL